MTRTFRLSIGLALATAALAACGETTDVSTDAFVRVLLTDAPIDYIAAAEVDIGAVELIPADEGAPIVLTEDGTPDFVNLLDLQNEVTLILAESEVESGTYAQIRFIVEAARVTLADGYEFNGGGSEQELFVPSGAQTGIKLNLSGLGEEGDGGLLIDGDVELVLDFDVARSFVIQGDPETPAGIQGILFTPTILVSDVAAAGSIAGTVSAPEGVSVEDLTVTATPVVDGDLEAWQSSTRVVMSAQDGTYRLSFLPPGTYTVTVTPPEGFTSTPESIEVEVGEGEEVVDVDFALSAV